MIATKFCDVCDTELPPMAFQNAYHCADVPLHKNHPDANISAVRITSTPHFTNGDGRARVDICPDCYLNLCKSLVLRMQRRNRKEASAIKEWKEWRQASRKEEFERNGCNSKRKVSK